MFPDAPRVGDPITPEPQFRSIRQFHQPYRKPESERLSRKRSHTRTSYYEHDHRGEDDRDKKRKRHSY